MPPPPHMTRATRTISPPRMAYPIGLAFSPDGTRMFVVGDPPRQCIPGSTSMRWPLPGTSPPPHMTDRRLVQRRPIPGGQLPYGLAFSAGRHQDVRGGGYGSNRVHQYYAGHSLERHHRLIYGRRLVQRLDPRRSTPTGLAFSPDGTKMFMLGYRQATGSTSTTLATPWNVTTASYDTGDSYSVVRSQEATFPTGLAFSADGTKMFMVGDTNRQGIPVRPVLRYLPHHPSPLDTTPPQIASAEYSSR